MNTTTLKKEILYFSHKLYQKGFVANHDGNISIKIASRILATPTSQSKGDITEEMLILLDEKGIKISGKYNVFSEINLHLASYNLRKDIQAVIHAHPPFTTAFACSGKSLEKIFIAEAIISLGKEIPLVPFIPPNCPETEKTLSQYLSHTDVLLLENHGVLAVGKNLAQAYYRLELVEHLAQIEWHSKALGGIKPLPEKTVQKLLEKRDQLGLGQPSLSKNLDLKGIIHEELTKYLSISDS